MKHKIITLLNRLRADERGLSTVEYVVLLVLIVAMAVAAWNTFGQDVLAKLTGASGDFNTQVRGGTGAAATPPATPGGN